MDFSVSFGIDADWVRHFYHLSGLRCQKNRHPKSGALKKIGFRFVKSVAAMPLEPLSAGDFEKRSELESPPVFSEILMSCGLKRLLVVVGFRPVLLSSLSLKALKIRWCRISGLRAALRAVGLRNASLWLGVRAGTLFAALARRAVGTLTVPPDTPAPSDNLLPE